jgi:hemin uptake protein HemP
LLQLAAISGWQKGGPVQMNTHDPQRFDRRFGRPAGDLSPPPEPIAATGRILSSDALFQGSREIGIEHFGSLYRLKITRQGKLILNK